MDEVSEGTASPGFRPGGAPVLRYASRRLDHGTVESLRLITLLAVILGAPLLLEAYIIGVARWVFAIVGHRGPLDDQYAVLLVNAPLIILALVYAAVAMRTVVRVYREEWSGNYSAVIPVLLVLWFLFYVLNCFTIWDDLFP